MGFLDSFFIFDNLPPGTLPRFACRGGQGVTWVGVGGAPAGVQQVRRTSFVSFPIIERPASMEWLENIAYNLVLLAATDKDVQAIETAEDAKAYVQRVGEFNFNDYNIIPHKQLLFIAHRGAGRWCTRGEEQTAIGLIEPEEVFGFEFKTLQPEVEWPSRFDRKDPL